MEQAELNDPKRPANRINPTGKPRGPAKTAVYRRLTDLVVNGRAAIFGGETCDKPLTGKEIAAELVNHAGYLEFVATTNAAPNHDEERERDGLLVTILRATASADELPALDDLNEIRASVMASEEIHYGIAKAAAVQQFKADHGRDRLPISDRLDRQAEAILKKRRCDEQKLAADYRDRQLMNLPHQPPEQQQRTIASWKHAVGLSKTPTGGNDFFADDA